MAFTLTDFKLWRSLASCWLASMALATQAADVQVAVAANFAGPMVPLAERFAASTGHQLKVSIGATGKFAAQIAAGAPFEVLLSADDTTPRKLVEQGLAVPGTAFAYATGQLVLWSPQAGVVDDQGKVLSEGRFAHLALANPKLAPYGQAAMQTLQAMGLADKLAPKLVLGDSVAQTWQFVATGNAELGFVALSQVQVPGKPLAGSMWVVPARLHSAIRQDAVLLKTGEKNPAAQAWLAFLKSAEAKAVIQTWGYTP